MIFGAIRKFSTIDFPGKLACVLGTKGCNMHCHWCHNYDLVSFEFSANCRIITEPEVLEFLKARAGFIEGVVISGGEPTLHGDLPEFCSEIQSLGFAVKLDTNGTNPEMIQRLMHEHLIDYVAMDIKTDFHNYPTITKNKFDPEKIKQSIELLLNGSLPYEFRTTCVKPFIDKANIEKIGALIRGADHYYLQKFDHTHVQNRDYAGNPDAGFDDAEMAELCCRVEPYVAECRIR
ncbi:MAG: anaerobic ribonucleoside-triphosphate reductase activating protein [Deltaproteobacteria bacterium]|nr:anaerobic ribonucleoside-triphosphate reductase activating protein [Deltaproteobacteria bacterium]MBW2175415.1 anaerobic ribonucleoside-triphosphate reductase activating protein [Deltaproteobacteria bacterium]